MATIESNVDQALQRANADDATIKTYAIQNTINWIDDQYRSFRWDFSRSETTESLSSGATSIALATDYWKMNTVKLKDSNGNYIQLEVIPREKFDTLNDPTTTGTPFVCSVLGSNLYFYYVPDKAYTVYYDYWTTAGTLTSASSVAFPDKIVEQVAYIAALSYDRLDTTVEEIKLKDMVAQFRRNETDGGNDGSQIPMDTKIFNNKPLNFY